MTIRTTQVTVRSYRELSGLYRRMARKVWPALESNATINEVHQVALYSVRVTPRDTGRLQHAWTASPGPIDGPMGAPGGPRRVTRSEIRSQLGERVRPSGARYVNAARQKPGGSSYASLILLRGRSHLPAGAFLPGLRAHMMSHEEPIFADAWERAKKKGRIR